MSKYFKIETNKPALSYKVGEKIVIKIRAYDNCNGIVCSYVKWSIAGDDGKRLNGLGSATPSSPLVLETTLERPGFIHINCQAFLEGNAPDNSFDVYDGGVAAEVEKLIYCDNIPDDYTEYWNGLKNTVDNFDYEIISKEQITNGVAEGFESYDVRLSTPGAGYASLVITMPKNAQDLPIAFGFMGYGIGRTMPGCSNEFIVCNINAHSIPNNKPNVVLADENKNLLGYGFNKEENQKPETTYWQGMFIRDLIAVKYAKSLPQWNKKSVKYAGGSQGAFQATNLAKLDSDTFFLEISIPWFCNINAKAHGYIDGWRPEYQNGTRYFDTVAAAMQVKCPVKITAFLGDYCCPPSTIMALYNSIKTEKQLDMVQGGTHGYRPPEVEKFTYKSDAENPESIVKPGKYRHYKGKEYEVLFVAKNSETLQETVVYKALYGNGEIWVRPKSMWFENVYAQGKLQKRFTYIG